MGYRVLIIRLFLGFFMCCMMSGLYAQPDIECCCGEPSQIDFPGGDFEDSTPPDPGGWIDYTAGQDFGAWTVSNGSISVHDGGHNGLGGGNPNGSSVHLDLHGFTVGGACTTIPGFTVGVEYVLVFWYAIHNAAPSASVTITIDGGAALNTSLTATNAGNVNWLEATYNFTATSANMQFCFEGNGPTPCCGFLMDDVSLWACDPDFEAPEIDPIPENGSFECPDQIPPPPSITVTDNCTDDPNLEFEEFINEQGCMINIERSWTVTDNCGNSTIYSQSIEVNDLEPPNLVIGPLDLTIGCDVDPQATFDDWILNNGGGLAMDNCGDVFWEPDVMTILADSCGTTEVTFTISDNCENSVETTASFTIADQTLPLLTELPIDLELGCADDFQFEILDWLANNGFAEAEDDCELTWTNNFNGIFDVQEVEFTATNVCGASVFAIASILKMNGLDTIRKDTFTCDITNAGIDEITINGADGCDSILLLNYEYIPADSIPLFLNTCNPNEAGVVTIVLPNSFGCDSVIIQTTTLTPADTVVLDSMICSASFIESDTVIYNGAFCDSIVVTNYQNIIPDTTRLNGFTCNSNEVLEDTVVLANELGCDSLVIRSILLSPSDTNYVSEPVCDPSAVGLEEIMLVNQFGCDSLIFVDSYLVDNDTIVVEEERCDIAGVVETITVIPGPFCDSIIIDRLIPASSDTTTVIDMVCQSTQASSDTIVLQNQMGCDSIIYSFEVYDPPIPVLVNLTTCFAADVGVDTIYSVANGCDSITIITSSLIAGNETYLTEQVCLGSSIETDTIYEVSSNGCDSIIYVDYFIDSILFDLTPSIDCGENLGSIAVDLLDGDGPFDYLLNQTAVGAPPFVDLAPGAYEVILVDSNNCNSLPKTIMIDSVISDLEITVVDTVYLNSSGFGELEILFSEAPDTFYFSDPTLLSCQNCLDPLVFSLSPTTLTLTVLDQAGCQYVEEIYLLLEEAESVFIPNVFSPNDDGVNDIFIPFASEEVKEVQSMLIFNRWGDLVYSGAELSLGGMEGWDGTFRQKRLDPAVFVYLIILEFHDGRTKQYSGDVLLMR